MAVQMCAIIRSTITHQLMEFQPALVERTVLSLGDAALQAFSCFDIEPVLRKENLH